MRKDNPAFVPDSPFARPMTDKHMAFFTAIPKTELHCHLLGTTQKSTFEDLVKESGAAVTQEEIDEIFNPVYYTKRVDEIFERIGLGD